MATANNMTAASTAAAAPSPDPAANSSNSKGSSSASSAVSSNSILQNRLCSQPKNYAAGPPPTSGPSGQTSSGNNLGPSASQQHPQNPQEQPMEVDNFSSDLQQPESPSLKMKIKTGRSNSSNFSNGNNVGEVGSSGSNGGGSASDKQTPNTETLSSSNSTTKKSTNNKKRKDLPTTSSSSTSSSRSSSPRSSASPISQLPPFLLAAMSGGGGGSSAPGSNGPRLDALLRQVATNGPPSKKAKLNGDCSNGSVESDESASPSSVASPLQGNTSGGNEAATMTEPESLGPCEPGTAVKVSGIVWQETEKGLLMLNVTWKGKTYMGTLLDCHIPLEEHKWGPPGELPVDKARGGKRGRCTRSRTPPVRIPIRKSQKAVNNKSNARAKQLFSLPVSPLAKENGHNKNKLQQHPFLQNYSLSTNPKTLKLESNFDDDNEESSDIKEDDSGDENSPTDPTDAMSPTSRLIECPKGLCAKKFRDLDALKYHLSYAHDNLNKAAEIKAEQTRQREQKLLAEKQQTIKAKLESESNQNKTTTINGSAPSSSSSFSSSKQSQQKLAKIKSEMINATTANNIVTTVKAENNGAVNKNNEVSEATAEVKPVVTTMATTEIKTEAAPPNSKIHGNLPLPPHSRMPPSHLTENAVKTEQKPPLHHQAAQPQSHQQQQPTDNNPGHTQRPQMSDAPLDLQIQRPASPAYSDISDEEPPLARPPPSMQPHSSISTPKNSLVPSNLPSLNSLVQRAPPLHTGHHAPPHAASASSHHGHHGQRDLRDQQQAPPQPPPAGSTKHILQQPPPPAHSNSLKKPSTSLSLEESLKRPPQFMPPGFPPGFPSQLLSGVAGAGLPAHLAAAVASGRYPPGFMPAAPQLPPGFSAVRSPYLNPPHTSATTTTGSSAASAAAKLQELQDRVMASSRPSGLHLGQLNSAMSQSGNPAPTISSFSTLARDLLPPSAASHYGSLSRMAAAAGTLNAAGLLPASASKHLPTFPGPK